MSLIFPNRNTQSRRKSRQKLARHSRRLRAESLEKRQLLAADSFHNHFDAEDVNDDGLVSAIDALAIINAMSRPTPDDGMFTDVNDDGQRSAIDALMVINRMSRDRGGRTDRGNNSSDEPSTETLPDAPTEIQSIDGTGNNLENPLLGSAGENFIRLSDADYADGISEPAGVDRPSPREISNLLSAADPDGNTSERDLTPFLALWGQFLDHDIDLSAEVAEDGIHESFDISVPVDDFLFNPSGSGDVVIPFTRSDFDPETGTSVDNPREQINVITSFIDGSQVYGSDQETADSLREFVGGRLLITENGLLPQDEEGGVLAGDVRAAENIGLTSMHALFVREHNRLADQISAADSELTDEEVYQQARAIVVAQLQSITYNEFLPALLGRGALESYRGYDSSVDPSIANEFATAAFRFGHSTLNDDIHFFDNDGQATQEPVALADAFFNPSLLEETGIDGILKSSASLLSQEIDLQVIDGLRNFLFGPPGAGGLDLVSLNIQRGRDHGLSDYNSTRVAYGLDAYDSFADLTSDETLQADLESLYGDINNVDLWVGLLAEDHERGASVGELTGTIIADQFQRLRDGDRFYYENTLSRSDIRAIERTSLADIIERNTDVEGLQDNVFFFRAEVRGTVSSGLADENDSGRRGRSDDGVEGVVVELLDDQGEVIATTTTNRRGDYRFRDFDSAGDYQVRLADSGETAEVSITGGGVRETVDFLVS